MRKEQRCSIDRIARAVAMLIAGIGMMTMPSSSQSPDHMLVGFGDPRAANAWQIVNDGVMGGRSRSTFTIRPDSTAIFEGVLSLANYGGFASVRTAPADHSLEGFAGVMLRVRGDGRIYQFRLRTDDRFEGVAFQASFQTRTDEWTTHRIPLADFVPTFRGRILADLPPLDPAAVRRIGFLLGDKQAGPFRLQIDWVGAYRDQER
jgi:monofunctional biosynthetic peptidoglycan transglycosylase